MAYSTHKITTFSAEETISLGFQLGQQLKAGDVVCLAGDMGAGKTTFAAGVGRGWGAEQPLTSPTYVIVRQYQRPADEALLYHLDVYRLDGDVESIGWDDIFAGEAAVLVEWAGTVRELLPVDALWVTISEGDEESARQMVFRAGGPRAQILMDAVGLKRAASD
jgi:tRNA threonylcarbamoyladenosine biosynthesis protein TsaE